MAKKKTYKSAIKKLQGGVGMGKPRKTRKPNGAKKKSKVSNIA